ncbi:MAG: hypothetical protein IPN81_11590 [Nitrosomonadales bacterium]|nr:hypothetical protein [Nitrosomonadales bacterium]
MSKPWQPYALHILDAIAKIQRIRMRGDIAVDEVLYDAALRNLQTFSEATQLLPDDRKAAFPSLTIAAMIDKNLPAPEESIRATLAQNHRNGNDQAH